MPVRTSPVAEADRRARYQLQSLVADLRTARLAAGLSQAVIARAIGVSRTNVTRWEQGHLRPALTDLARWAAAVGLETPFRGLPGPSPVRDAGQLRTLARAGNRIGPGWSWRTEVPVAADARDRRAVDAVIRRGNVAIGLEVITRLVDVQAQVRRALLKQEALHLDRMVLVLSDTRHNRAALREGAPSLVPAFPMSSRQVLHALHAGCLPAGNGTLLV
jgi:transcriptional regulator with XRE-family HTH domain